MRRIDELFTTWPFLGSQRLTALLRTEGHSVNRKRVQRLMRKMGIAALGPRPRTTKPAPGHKIFPYLLRGITVEQPNQVWCARISPTSRLAAAFCIWWRSWTGPAGRRWRSPASEGDHTDEHRREGTHGSYSSYAAG